VLLLAGILLIVVVVIAVLRSSIIPAANQTLQGGLEQWREETRIVIGNVLLLDGSQTSSTSNPQPRIGAASEEPWNASTVNASLTNSLIQIPNANLSFSSDKTVYYDCAANNITLKQGQHNFVVRGLTAAGVVKNVSLSFSVTANCSLIVGGQQVGCVEGVCNPSSGLCEPPISVNFSAQPQRVIQESSITVNVTLNKAPSAAWLELMSPQTNYSMTCVDTTCSVTTPVVEPANHSYRVWANDSAGSVGATPWNWTLTGWWNLSYGVRRQVNVSTVNAIQRGYSINLTTDTGHLINASRMLANGSDARTVFWNSSSGANAELDRTWESTVEDNTTGLVGLWRFDEGAGNVTRDESGSGNDGVLKPSPPSDAPQWTNDSKFGKSLSFDGSDDYVNVSHSTSLNIISDLSMAGWAYIRSYPPSYYGGLLAGKAYTSPTPGYAGEMYQDGRAYFYIRDNADHWTEFRSNSVLPLNQWTHVAFVFNDTANIIAIYINGRLDNSTTWSYPIGSNTDPLHIGHGHGGWYYLNGSIDEVAIYNRALSAQEIQDHYNKTRLWFALRENVSANNYTTSYWLYYNNSQAGAAPEDKNRIYLFYDDFEGTSLNSSKWSTQSMGGGFTINVANSILNISTANPTYNNFINTTIAFSIRKTFETRVYDVPSTCHKGWGFGRPGVSFLSNNTCAPCGPVTTGVTVTETSGVRPVTDVADWFNAWQTMRAYWINTSITKFYNTTSWLSTHTTWIPSDPMAFYIQTQCGWTAFDWVKVREYVLPEPIAALASQEQAKP
jgi:hypothetical protein